ncbi:hypothetical protein B2G71_02120 [Novosphingobium sp. PC22D]|uniref:hypothetical protein n=1 Tax=Novosphingobium sp. PC22D TaxID=1962403 RepID=UPI000BEFB7D2|nr:hypothetical protein [Novosphingobium sp. PC22D]PEQ14412.1 hypothetical protein B2G71_02120 [Novosphingobium sp. PC22D]
MPAFYLTLIAVLLSGWRARDQADIAGLTRAQGQRPAVLVVAILVSIATAALAAYAATLFRPLLPPPARIWFVAIALGLAGAESLAIAPRKVPSEPTRSLGALALLLLAHQVTDAPRFITFGLAAGMAAPLASGLGGAIGGAVLAGAAWAFPQFAMSPGARHARRAVGALLLVAAIIVAFRESGIL